jgi:hypothetical protein
VSFGAAFDIGEGITTALTNDTVSAEFWQMLAAVIPALLGFASPGILSVLQGRKAMHPGADRDASRCRSGLKLSLVVATDLLSHAWTLSAESDISWTDSGRCARPQGAPTA